MNKENTNNATANTVAALDPAVVAVAAELEAAVDKAAALAAEATGELENGEFSHISDAVAALRQTSAKYAGAGEYLVNLGKGTLATLIKDFTPPKSEKKASVWVAPKMPADLMRVKIVCASYSARAIAGADIMDGEAIKPTYGVHSTRYTLRLTFRSPGAALPYTVLLTDFAARTGFAADNGARKYYSTGAARLDKMVILFKLMREAWGLNAKGEPKK